MFGETQKVVVIYVYFGPVLAVVVPIWLSKQPFHGMAPKCVRNVPEVTRNIPWTHQSVLEPVYDHLTAKFDKKN